MSAKWLGRLWSWGLRLQCASWRVDTEGLNHINELYTRGIPFIAVFWHGKYVPLLVLLRAYSGCIFSSRSPRGDVIAEICRQFGYECSQIADGGGDASLEQMQRVLSSRLVGAIALDGPLGPRHMVHRGSIELASRLGCVLLPVSTASRRKRVRTKRWDKMEFPSLWTRVSLVIGEPLTVPPRLGRDDIRLWSTRVKDAVVGLDWRAAEMVQSENSDAGRETRS